MPLEHSGKSITDIDYYNRYVQLPGITCFICIAISKWYTTAKKSKAAKGSHAQPPVVITYKGVYSFTPTHPLKDDQFSISYHQLFVAAQEH
jgi:hypothetical protein